jgi:hypothetical protein
MNSSQFSYFLDQRALVEQQQEFKDNNNNMSNTFAGDSPAQQETQDMPRREYHFPVLSCRRGTDDNAAPWQYDPGEGRYDSDLVKYPDPLFDASVSPPPYDARSTQSFGGYRSHSTLPGEIALAESFGGYRSRVSLTPPMPTTPQETAMPAVDNKVPQSQVPIIDDEEPHITSSMSSPAPMNLLNQAFEPTITRERRTPKVGVFNVPGIWRGTPRPFGEDNLGGPSQHQTATEHRPAPSQPSMAPVNSGSLSQGAVPAAKGGLSTSLGTPNMVSLGQSSAQMKSLDVASQQRIANVVQGTKRKQDDFQADNPAPQVSSVPSKKTRTDAPVSTTQPSVHPLQSFPDLVAFMNQEVLVAPTAERPLGRIGRQHFWSKPDHFRIACHNSNAVMFRCLSHAYSVIRATPQFAGVDRTIRYDLALKMMGWDQGARQRLVSRLQAGKGYAEDLQAEMPRQLVLWMKGKLFEAFKEHNKTSRVSLSNLTQFETRMIRRAAMAMLFEQFEEIDSKLVARLNNQDRPNSSSQPPLPSQPVSPLGKRSRDSDSDPNLNNADSDGAMPPRKKLRTASRLSQVMLASDMSSPTQPGPGGTTTKPPQEVVSVRAQSEGLSHAAADGSTSPLVLSSESPVLPQSRSAAQPQPVRAGDATEQVEAGNESEIVESIETDELVESETTIDPRMTEADVAAAIATCSKIDTAEVFTMRLEPNGPVLVPTSPRPARNLSNFPTLSEIPFMQDNFRECSQTTRDMNSIGKKCAEKREISPPPTIPVDDKVSHAPISRFFARNRNEELLSVDEVRKLMEEHGA